VEYVIGAILLVALAWFVSVPLRRPRREGGPDDRAEDPLLADLEARKEALYRQIRDAELDREQGKLSAADHARIDTELRRDAIALLKRIDAMRGSH
jgi:hypothetical protein